MKIVITTALILLSLGIQAQKRPSKQSTKPTSTKPAESTPVKEEVLDATHIQWLTMPDALAKNEKVKKKILIDFYTDWCGWCKVMDKKTYEDSRVIAAINRYYYPVKFNAETQGPFTYKGKEYKIPTGSMRATHEFVFALNNSGSIGYPTTSFLSQNLDLIQSIPGYIEAKEMPIILNYIGQDLYKSISYEKFHADQLPK